MRVTFRDFNHYSNIPCFSLSTLFPSFEFFTITSYISANPNQVEPPLSQFAALDAEELGEASVQTAIKHLKDIKAASVKEYGRENILGETEARNAMIGVTIFLSLFHPI